ncbi:MAG: hypothetical protein JSV46_03385 [Candidatus Aminicenantes bacterium]|nr:MAG: hypothetical protein JSV46_03385 [Candidatus Aminicenantes bacterium]
MSKADFLPRKVYIEKKSLNRSLTKRILKNIGRHVPLEIIEDSQDFLDMRKISRDSVEHGKKELFITSQKGEFVKPSPCTPHTIGCNYYIINLDLNCPLDCTYCILQYYLSDPVITVHTNLDDLWRQLDVFLNKKKDRPIRIGTGELGDSLLIDHLTGNSIELISYFKNKSNVIFELKTKTVNIENVLKSEPAPNIVISWSLNSSTIAESEEQGSPAIDERIKAARRVVDRGFRVGFHFDPLILYPGCEKDYRDVVENLLEHIDPTRIAWISLGSLRFPPSLKEVIRERFPETKIIHSEMIKGKDGKLRYFKPLRLELYRNVVRTIKEKGGRRVPLYLCMEGKSIWREVLGWVPRGEEGLEAYLSSPLGKSVV